MNVFLRFTGSQYAETIDRLTILFRLQFFEKTRLECVWQVVCASEVLFVQKRTNSAERWYIFVLLHKNHHARAILVKFWNAGSPALHLYIPSDRLWESTELKLLSRPSLFKGCCPPLPNPNTPFCLTNLMGGHRAENKSKAPKAAGLWPMQIHEVNQTSTRRPRCPKVRPDRLGPNLPNHSLSERVVHLLDFFMNCLQYI